MTVILSASERRRLTSILGMLGSNAAGERDTAARMAEAFRTQHKLTWEDLLALPPVVAEVIPEPPPPKAKPATAAAPQQQRTTPAYQPSEAEYVAWRAQFDTTPYAYATIKRRWLPRIKSGPWVGFVVVSFWVFVLAGLAFSDQGIPPHQVNVQHHAPLQGKL